MTPAELKNHYELTRERLLWITDEIKRIDFKSESKELINQLSDNSLRLRTVADIFDGLITDLGGETPINPRGRNTC